MDQRRGTHDSARSAPSPGEAPAGFARVALAGLLGSGAESERIAARAQQIADVFDGHAQLALGWTESTLTFVASDGQTTTHRFEAPPAAVAMNKVMAIDGAINGLSDKRLTLDQAAAGVRKALKLPPANVFLFAAACAVGAGCLAVIFGVEHWQPVGLIALAAALGAFVRRGLAKLGASNFWQAGAAAFLAGLIGALAVDMDWSSPLRLATVCPCMVLVPGPHLLNGSLDLAALRIPLGIARLAFATVTLLAIGAGVLVGLWAGGASLVLDPASREIPIWLDALAGGVVAICYGVFYSAPLRILFWPFAVGAVVHALRWLALYQWHLDPWVGAGLACLVAGFLLIPVSARFQVPFSAVGFASVVSLMPGLLVFRTLAALSMLQSAKGDAAQPLVVSLVNDANVALLTVLAMAIGFLVPAACYRLLARLRRSPSVPA